MRRSILPHALTLALAASGAQAGTVAAFLDNNDGGNLAVALQGPGVTTATSTVGAGLTRVGTLHVFRGYDTTDPFDALAAGDVFTFTFSSAIAYDLTDLTFVMGRNNGGPTRGAYRVTTSSGGVTQAAFNVLVGGNPNTFSIPLALGPGFQNVTGATIEIVGFNASDPAGGTAGISQAYDAATAPYALEIEGTVVPLPPGLALALGGIGALALLRRRRG